MADKLAMRRSLLALALALVVTVLPGGLASGQDLPEEWIQESDRLMREYRSAELRVVVLDAEGSRVPGAVVQAIQVGHDISLGFMAGPSGLDGIDFRAPVYRHFNTISLDQLMAWRDTQSRPNDAHGLLSARRVAHQATQQGLSIRFGPLVSQDPAINPDWLGSLNPTDLSTSIQDRIDDVLSGIGHSVDSTAAIDVLADDFSHNDLSDRLGPQVRRLLFHWTRSSAPKATLSLRLRDMLTGTRRSRLAGVVASVREDFLMANAIALDERITGGLQRAPLLRTINAIDQLDLELSISSLNIGGSSPEAAAYNLELLLRTIVPSRVLQNVTFAHVIAPDEDESLLVPHGGLVTKTGQLTLAGAMFDRLLGDSWRSNEMAVADPELATAAMTLFAGSYELNVMLPPSPEYPEGQSFIFPLYLPASDQPRIVIAQPLRLDKPASIDD